MAKSAYIGEPIAPPNGRSDAARVRKKRLQQRKRRSFTNTAQSQRSNSGRPFKKNKTLSADTRKKAVSLTLGKSPMLKTTVWANRNATTEATTLTSLVL